MTWQKRLFDLTIALLLAAVLLPPFAVLLIFLLLKEGRPIFYVAERMKAPGVPFHLWKLRTMTVVCEDSGVSGGDKAAIRAAIDQLTAAMQQNILQMLPYQIGVALFTMFGTVAIMRLWLSRSSTSAACSK